MQLKHPLYDFGAIALVHHVSALGSMVDQLLAKPDLPEESIMRMQGYKLLNDRFAELAPELAVFCALQAELPGNNELIHASYSRIAEALLVEDRPDVGAWLAMMGDGIVLLTTRSDSPAKSLALHILTGAYTLYYSIYQYFCHGNPQF